ncbi:hypothetical protein EVAR_39309_1 [Eumeta japonica]|uniref:Uncharacterized protein n=1 Tax=Eumeta variegata TaxID=151549 RepID=A0A4C1VWQ1_EUMVA|nr:hypothetical protein EVAR_39309_1 [Eumeta japonica]
MRKIKEAGTFMNHVDSIRAYYAMRQPPLQMARNGRLRHRRVAPAILGKFMGSDILGALGLDFGEAQLEPVGETAGIV